MGRMGGRGAGGGADIRRHEIISAVEKLYPRSEKYIRRQKNISALSNLRCSSAELEDGIVLQTQVANEQVLTSSYFETSNFRAFAWMEIFNI